MNKKVMALAVAGALAAPVSALAQTQIYGVFNVEYGIYDAPNSAAGVERHRSDAWNSGASRIGIRGQEKLAGSNSAWYQCESDVRFLAGATRTSGSLCDRNSAIGLRGNFGNFFAGTWDSPLKTATGTTRITNETGWLGTQGLLLTGFSNRNPQTLNYQTPNMSGFMLSAQVGTTNASLDQPETSATDGRVQAFGANYSAGPLVIVAGIETLDKDKADTPGANAEDRAWAIGATFVFGAFKVGLTYTDIELDDGVGAKEERSAIGLAGTYRTGPHLFTLGLTLADDTDVGGTTVPDSGAKQFVVSYNHYLSKRTNVGIGYSKVDNDAQGDYNLTGRSRAIVPGSSADVVSVNLTHSF